MHSRAKSPTKAEKKRMAAIAEIGCVACRMTSPDLARLGPTPEVHHLLDGGTRRGHAFTIALCGWHHAGRPADRMGKEDTEALCGPSLAHGSKPFHAHYGTDDELLEYQNTLLEAAGFVLPTGPNLSSGECHGDDC